MASLDFREIPPANEATGRQDAFELFARETLQALGFTIVLDPSRGADGGKDLVVEEQRVGPLRETRVKWLVSCKHFAHSGRSVTPSDELNVLERVKVADCDGFLGFYSTLPSTGLQNLVGGQSGIEVCLLDHESIERRLLGSVKGHDVVKRYFPASYSRLKPQPARLYDQVETICCESCGKDLLEPPSGIWVLWHGGPKAGKVRVHYVDMHFTCKRACDAVVESRVHARHAQKGSIYPGWDDIPDILVPTIFISKVMAVINGYAAGDTYEPDALDKMKRLLLAAFPHVSRNLTVDEERTIERLQHIPSYLGGMGSMADDA